MLADAALGGALTALFFGAVLPFVAGVALLVLRSRNRHESAAARVILLRPNERLDAIWLAQIEADTAQRETPIERFIVVHDVAPALDMRGVLVVPRGADPVNPKIAKLRAGLDRLPSPLRDEDILVSADTDVRFDAGSLSALVDSLPEKLSAVSFGVPMPEGGTFLGQWLSKTVLTCTTQSFASVWQLERLLGGAPSLAGKATAMRASTLNAIGGYENLEAFIGDDLALSRAVHRAHGKVLLGPEVRVENHERTFASQEAQFVRWLRVLFAHRPFLAPLYPFTNAPLALAVPLLIVAECTQRGSVSAHPWILESVSLIVGLRIFHALVLRFRIFRSASAGATILRALTTPVVDFLLLGAWIGALSSRKIVWRDREYAVTKGGRITSVLRSRS